MLGIWLITMLPFLAGYGLHHDAHFRYETGNDPVYRERLAAGLIEAPKGEIVKELKPFAKRSVGIFLLGVIAVVLYASAISPAVGSIKPVIVPRDAAIMSIMLAIGTIITMTCRFKSVMLLPPASSRKRIWPA